MRLQALVAGIVALAGLAMLSGAGGSALGEGGGGLPEAMGATEGAAEQDDGGSAPSVLITGANRGIGLEFARQYHEAGWMVIGTARHPEGADELKALGVRVEQLDVTDPESVAALAESLDGAPLDLLINNAGIGSRSRSFESVDVEDVAAVMDVNCFGAMRVTKALLANLKAGRKKLIINITSGLGSIELNTSGMYYGYRESKAALNMFTRSIAAELKPEGFICIVLSPGWVRTDMGGPMANLSPEESISAMREVIAGLGPDDAGKFLRHNGETVPW